MQNKSSAKRKGEEGERTEVTAAYCFRPLSKVLTVTMKTTKMLILFKWILKELHYEMKV